jgi:hypothetical protein
MQDVSEYLISTTAAPEEADFDYNGFWEGVQERLEALGVYRDIAGEEDRQTKRDQEEEAGQQTLPFQESKVFELLGKNYKINLELLSSKVFCLLVTYRHIGLERTQVVCKI